VKPAIMATIRLVAQMSPVIVVLAMVFLKMRETLKKDSHHFSTLGVLEFLACVALYCITGPAVILLNRYIMTDYGFRFPVLLASLGNVFLMAVTRAAVVFGWKKIETEHLDWSRYLRIVVPINVFNVLSQVAGMYAFLFISIPQIQILKSLIVVMVLGLSWLLLGERVNNLLASSVIMISFGAVLSAMFSGYSGAVGDTAASFIVGVALMLAANAFEAVKTVTSQVLMDNMSLFDGIYHSSPCFVLFAAVLVGCVEAKGLAGFAYSGVVVGLLTTNAAVTGLVVLSSFWLVKLGGGLAMKIVTQARSIGLVLCSVFFFGDSCSIIEYIGFTITLIGMVMFDSAKQALRGQDADGRAAGDDRCDDRQVK